MPLKRSAPALPARLRPAAARARRLLRREPGLAAAYLFGSALKGPRPRDVDIALLYAPPSRAPRAGRLAELALGLDKAFHAEVDLHVATELPDPVGFRVVRDGVRLLARDRLAAVRFEADTVSRFLDFRPAYDWLAARVIARPRAW